MVDQTWAESVGVAEESLLESPADEPEGQQEEPVEAEPAVGVTDEGLDLDDTRVVPLATHISMRQERNALREQLAQSTAQLSEFQRLTKDPRIIERIRDILPNVLYGAEVEAEAPDTSLPGFPEDYEFSSEGEEVLYQQNQALLTQLQAAVKRVETLESTANRVLQERMEEHAHSAQQQFDTIVGRLESETKLILTNEEKNTLLDHSVRAQNAIEGKRLDPETAIRIGWALVTATKQTEAKRIDGVRQKKAEIAAARPATNVTGPIRSVVGEIVSPQEAFERALAATGYTFGE